MHKRQKKLHNPTTGAELIAEVKAIEARIDALEDRVVDMAMRTSLALGVIVGLGGDMRGRKPQAFEVALRKNNPGGRPLNTRAPKHPALDPAVPAELRDERARAEWSRVVEALSAGHVSTVDRAVLLGYCTHYAEWQSFEAMLAEEGALRRTRGKARTINPALGLAHKAYTLLLKSAGELGLTPATRTRIVVPPQPEEVDDFSTHQRERLTLAKGSHGARGSSSR